MFVPHVTVLKKNSWSLSFHMLINSLLLVFLLCSQQLAVTFRTEVRDYRTQDRPDAKAAKEQTGVG